MGQGSSRVKITRSRHKGVQNNRISSKTRYQKPDIILVGPSEKELKIIDTNNKILIVDDDPNLRKTLEDIFRAKGYMSISVGSGKKALKIIKKEKPAVALIDLKLKDISGLEVIKRVRKQSSATECIVLTGHASKESAIEAVNLGAYSYAQKPCDMDQLLLTIRQAFKKHNAEEALQRKHQLQSILNIMLSISLKPIGLVEMLDRILEQITSIPWFTLPRGAVLLVEDKPDELVLKSYRNFNGKPVSKCTRVPFGRCLCGRAASAKEIEFADCVDGRHENRYKGISTHGHYCVPIISSGKILGVLSLYLETGHRRNKEEEDFLLGITDGLAGIVERKRAEVGLKQSVEKLQRILGETVSALASALAMRDPYTAGHQQRVAQLAQAIGREMDLPPKQVEGVLIAGTLHDIGKIYIPAEILSKPAKLTEVEFNFMKTHPQIGYEIIKEIEFDWPVAQAVLQHHERLDGKGYPAGLSGKKMILEAKILAVADVIEAMSSHRPYRPAKGLEKALGEISKNKGVLYDADVANAALRLFNKKGFKFE